MSPSEEIERAQGVSGELVLRRGPARSRDRRQRRVPRLGGERREQQGAGHRRLAARERRFPARPHRRARHRRRAGRGAGLRARRRRCTVAELEPVVVRWFREHGGAAAARAAADERSGRARIVVADVADVLGAPADGWDVVALDTDNGPEWLVRGENAGLYAPAGLRRVHDALRPGGVAVFWSPDRYPGFERRSGGGVRARDMRGGRRRDRWTAVRLHHVRRAPPGRRRRVERGVD